MAQLAPGVECLEKIETRMRAVLSVEALTFIAKLHRAFNPLRERRLHDRVERQRELDAGKLPEFLAETRHIRESQWLIAPAPEDLMDRRVEITGPVERKMMINALNSGASVFMADFEDALSPTWSNVVYGQLNCMDAVRRKLAYDSPEGKRYELSTGPLATLLVRPRGWHLIEDHIKIDGAPVSATLLDFGLYLFLNAKELLRRGTGAYFYLPKIESHREARLWREVFEFSEVELGIPHGSIRATVLIETIPAAFEMDEILYELREYISGLNAGRWDYIFSIIKKMNADPRLLFPDRAEVTMDVPFMRAYAQLLVKTCHRRGAHAIGGMSAFVPSRRDPAVNEIALRKVREDKLREAGDGFDGTWVAHPDLVPVAREVFDTVLGSRPHQKDKLRNEFNAGASDLLNFRIPSGRITEPGLRNNVSVALQYLSAWLGGTGAVTINHLMEDAATAEIARAQLWLWIRRSAPLAEGGFITVERYLEIRNQEEARLSKIENAATTGYLNRAAELLDRLVLNDHFEPFLTSFALKEEVAHGERRAG